jgi:hypothetical protein
VRQVFKAVLVRQVSLVQQDLVSQALLGNLVMLVLWAILVQQVQQVQETQQALQEIQARLGGRGQRV